MKDRIFDLIDALEMTAGRFADEIGVERSTMTHIKTERSKPSLEQVQKIKNRFPKVSIDWLIFGTGSMFLATGDSQAADLFSQKDLIDLKSDDYHLRKHEKQAYDSNTQIRQARIKPMEYPENSLAEVSSISTTENLQKEHFKELRKVKRIIIYYSDGTFEEFYN